MNERYHGASKETETPTEVDKNPLLLSSSKGSSELLDAHFSGAAARLREGVEIDWKEAAHDFKLAGDQGNAGAQFNYGACLADDRNVSMDLATAPHYFKLAADQGNLDAQFNS
jgi:hypothetical protein